MLHEKEMVRTSLLTNFKVWSYGSGTGKQAREHHVHRNSDASTHIPFTYLDVLNFRS